MYKLPKKHKGDRLKAGDWNDHVDAINDTLNRSNNFNAMLPASAPSGNWGGGRYAERGEGFSLRSMTKTGDKWTAYFTPGRVLEVHAGGTRVVVPKINGKLMDTVPYEGVEAKKDKKLFLDLVFGASDHDCITAATVSTTDEPPGGKVVRLILGEFAPANEGSGAGIDDVIYKPYLTGCITYANGSRSEGWRVIVATDKEGVPKAAYVRQGDIYIMGKQGKAGSGSWDQAPAAQGDIWLNVQCNAKGVYQSHHLGTSSGGSEPLKIPVAEADKDKGGKYAFKLATIKQVAEPMTTAGNPAALVAVKQFALGAVYCTAAKGEDAAADEFLSPCPFACDVVNGQVRVRRNHGMMIDVNGKPMTIAWGAEDAMMLGVAKDGTFGVVLGWEYLIGSSPGTATIKILEAAASDGDQLSKIVQQPIKNEPAKGRSHVVLAVVTRVTDKITSTVKVDKQLVHTSLRAYWLPGYVDGESGALGQYADASVGVYDGY